MDLLPEYGKCAGECYGAGTGCGEGTAEAGSHEPGGAERVLQTLG